MKIFVQLASCFLALHAATLVDPTLMEWQEFKARFGKSYKTQEEEEFRMEIFMNRRTLIAEHNEKYERGEVTYKMGINKFSDMLRSEFMNTDSGLNHSETPTRNFGRATSIPSKNSVVPDEVNWVEKGAVTPVKDEGNCKSSYVFSTTGSIESRNFIESGTLVSLSEQNIIDCASEVGCNGGSYRNAYVYVEGKGIDTEASYPFEGKQGPCRFNNKTVGASIRSYISIWPDDEDSLQSAVAQWGPISGIIHMSENFYCYHSGVFKDPECNDKDPIQAILVVGYGTDKATSEKYWLVKNSWGTDWGEKGYMRVARNAGNMCGIANVALFPLM